MIETAKADTLRAFVALPVSEEVNVALHALQEWLKRETGGQFVRWVRAGQFHLTMRFFGAIPLAHLPAVEAALRRAVAGQTAIDLTAARTGTFGSLRNPKVVWAGISGGLAALRTLHGRIGKETFKFGQRPDEKIFQPHLTLGRVGPCSRDECRRLAEVLAAKADVKLGSWRATAVQLIRSDVSSAGAVYTELAQFPFANSPTQSSSTAPAVRSGS
ncbi:MAG: RNA 2',3'-cyclic phosphodiesterase [Verrucomicrobia bacterium]|nr:RNA 2',3'-cyclic phosphodiesterase [Verrucomicrobiota bacterium]